MTVSNGSFMPVGQLFIISAPSGAGKTSLVAAIRARLVNLVVSISHTTRLARSGEIDGRDYHFTTHSQFQLLVAEGALFEYAKVFGNFYGTSKKSVTDQLEFGFDVILEIDWQGAAQIKAIIPDAISIFILPPTRSALRQRLFGREKDDISIINARMAEAEITIKQAPHFDYWIINDDFEIALEQLNHIVASHRQRQSKVKAQHPKFLEKLLGQR